MPVTASIIIPTYNAAPYLEAQLKALLNQTCRGDEILIIDSSSLDRTLEIARAYHVRTMVIPKAEFDHGGTRTLAGHSTKGEFLVYLTQDALLANEWAIENLLRSFDDAPHLGVVFGRQLPRPDASPFAQHLRLFNYPEKAYTRTLSDRMIYGLKTAFCSNSFAAYRRSALDDIGWFQAGLLLGEDMHAAARMLLKGYTLGYAADAMVYHSHNYSMIDECKRYFDTGAFHKQERWLLEEFGRPEGEGMQYVKSELTFLWSNGFARSLPLSLLRAFLKLAGYQLGSFSDKLPGSVVKRLSMHAK